MADSDQLRGQDPSLLLLMLTAEMADQGLMLVFNRLRSGAGFADFHLRAAQRFDLVDALVVRERQVLR